MTGQSFQNKRPQQAAGGAGNTVPSSSPSRDIQRPTNLKNELDNFLRVYKKGNPPRFDNAWVVEQLHTMEEALQVRKDELCERLLSTSSLYRKTVSKAQHPGSFAATVASIDGFINDASSVEERTKRVERRQLMCDVAALYLVERVREQMLNFVEGYLSPQLQNPTDRLKSAGKRLSVIAGFLEELAAWQDHVAQEMGTLSDRRTRAPGRIYAQYVADNLKDMEHLFGRNVRDCLDTLGKILELSEKGLPPPKASRNPLSTGRLPRGGRAAPRNGRPLRGFDE